MSVGISQSVLPKRVFLHVPCTGQWTVTLRASDATTALSSVSLTSTDQIRNFALHTDARAANIRIAGPVSDEAWWNPSTSIYLVDGHIEFDPEPVQEGIVEDILKLKRTRWFSDTGICLCAGRKWWDACSYWYGSPMYRYMNICGVEWGPLDDGWKGDPHAVFGQQDALPGGELVTTRQFALYRTAEVLKDHGPETVFLALLSRFGAPNMFYEQAGPKELGIAHLRNLPNLRPFLADVVAATRRIATDKLWVPPWDGPVKGTLVDRACQKAKNRDDPQLTEDFHRGIGLGSAIGVSS